MIGILEVSCNNTKRLFQIKSITKRTCKNCQNEKYFPPEHANSINIYVPNNGRKEIDFAELQRLGLDSDHHGYICEVCSYLEHSSTEFFELQELTQYLILKLSSNMNNNDGSIRRINCKIKNFDPDRVKIENLNTNDHFVVKSAIFHYTLNANDDGRAGHYIIWIRSKCNSGWIRISDSSGKFFQNLVNDLKDVVILILEKINFADA